VGDLGAWEGSVSVWDFRWRKPLFVWESDLLVDLLLMARRPTCLDKEDEWSWSLSPDGHFSVKSAYLALSKGLSPTGARRERF